MELWQLGLIGVVAGYFTVTMSQRRAKQRGIDRLVPLLRDKGPLSIPEIMIALNLDGFTAHGKITMELAMLVQSGQVIELPVPEGTSHRDKLQLRKYAYSSSSSPAVSVVPG